jgi:hypothetical protein
MVLSPDAGTETALAQIFNFESAFYVAGNFAASERQEQLASKKCERGFSPRNTLNKRKEKNK